MPLAQHPFMKGWRSANGTFVQSAGETATPFVAGPFEKLTTPVDKAITALDHAITARDVDKSQKAFFAYLEAMRTYKKKVVAAAKKDPAVDAIKAPLKTLLQHLDAIEGEAEIDMPKAKVQGTQFVKDWTFAKKKFEAATGKKKPSAGLLKMFRASSGITKALEAADKAAAASDPVKYNKARAAYFDAKDAYTETILKALKKDGLDDDYKVELQDLKLRLETIAGAISNVVF